MFNVNLLVEKGFRQGLTPAEKTELKFQIGSQFIYLYNKNIPNQDKVWDEFSEIVCKARFLTLEK